MPKNEPWPMSRRCSRRRESPISRKRAKTLAWTSSSTLPTSVRSACDAFSPSRSKDSTRFPAQAESNRRISKEPSLGHIDKIEAPLLVCTVSFVNLEAVYCWLLEPIVEKGRSGLLEPAKHDWRPLDEEGSARDRCQGKRLLRRALRFDGEAKAKLSETSQNPTKSILCYFQLPKRFATPFERPRDTLSESWMREIRTSRSTSEKWKRSMACGAEPRRGNPDTRKSHRLNDRATSRLYSLSSANSPCKR